MLTAHGENVEGVKVALKAQRIEMPSCRGMGTAALASRSLPGPVQPGMSAEDRQVLPSSKIYEGTASLIRALALVPKGD